MGRKEADDGESVGSTRVLMETKRTLGYICTADLSKRERRVDFLRGKKRASSAANLAAAILDARSFACLASSSFSWRRRSALKMDDSASCKFAPDVADVMACSNWSVNPCFGSSVSFC